MRNKLIALAAAAALAAGPTMAQAQTAPAPLAAAARAGADLDDANGIRGGVILPTLAIILIIGVLALTDTWPFDEPESP